MAIVDYIASLETKLTNAKEEMQNLKTHLTPNSQNNNKPPSTGFFGNKIPE